MVVSDYIDMATLKLKIKLSAVVRFEFPLTFSYGGLLFLCVNLSYSSVN